MPSLKFIMLTLPSIYNYFLISSGSLSNSGWFFMILRSNREWNLKFVKQGQFSAIFSPTNVIFLFIFLQLEKMFRKMAGKPFRLVQVRTELDRFHHGAFGWARRRSEVSMEGSWKKSSCCVTAADPPISPLLEMKIIAPLRQAENLLQ